MVTPRTWPSVLCLLFIVAASLTTPGQVNSSEVEVKDDATKTECRKHIEEALNKYWDHETGTYQTVDGSKVNTEEKIETDHKTTTAEQNEVNTNEKPCEDDDNDGICNEDEVEEVQEPAAQIPETPSQATATSDDTKSICPDDDGDGICNEDEVEETESPAKQSDEKDKNKEDNENAVNDDDAEDEEEEEEREARKVLKKKKKDRKRSKHDEDEDEEDDSISRRKKKRKQRVAYDEDEEEENVKKIKRKGKSRKHYADEDEEDEDGERENYEDEDGDDRRSRRRHRGKEEKDDEIVEEKEKEKEEEQVKNEAKSTSEPKETPAQTAQPTPVVEPVVEPEPEPESDSTDITSGKSHVDEILRLGEIGSKEEIAEQNLILSIFRDLKKIYTTSIKPLETMYKYREISTRIISDAEIFARPMVLILGPKGSGKTSLVNYLLGLQATPWQLNTGISTSYPHFTLLVQGDTFTKLSPTELSADFTFSGLQQFGQHFVEHHLQAFKMPLDVLQKMTIVDCPGFIDDSLMPKEPGKGIDGEVYQWFIDRSDVIYIMIDVNQLHLTNNLHSLLEQLRGRDVRFIISKSDSVTHSQIVTLIGQLLWALSPLMTNNQPPQVFALTTQMETYEPFLDLQEQEWLKDLSNQVSGLARVESHIAEVRRHAVRVRNHAKIIDCYLSTYYRNKGLFMFGTSAKKFASEITENPNQYRVFSGALAAQAQNISRYDLPDPELYRDFFRSNNLLDFKQLSATCSFFKGCPLDKLDVAISYQLPDLVSKYKRLTKFKTN